jgi:hypothetical protein
MRDKLILYGLSILLLCGGIFMLIDSSSGEYNPLWSILPFGLSITIALLATFKKVN